MTLDQLKAHLYAFAMGLLGSMATAAGLAAISYLGAHIPDLLAFFTTAIGGAAAVHQSQ